MRVQLRVENEDPDSVRALRTWLQEERTVRAFGDLQWGRADSAQHMGVAIDVLTLAVGSGLSLLQLALSIAQWRSSRHPAPVVIITRDLGDGTTVRVETSDPAALAEAVRTLEAA